MSVSFRLETGIKNLRDLNGEVLEAMNDPDEFWNQLCTARDQITQQEINDVSHVNEDAKQQLQNIQIF